MIKHHYTVITGGDITLCLSATSAAVHSKDGVAGVSVVFVLFKAESCGADDLLPSAVAEIHKRNVQSLI